MLSLWEQVKGIFTNRLKKCHVPLQISEGLKIFSQKGCAFDLSQWELVEGYFFKMGIHLPLPSGNKWRTIKFFQDQGVHLMFLCGNKWKGKIFQKSRQMGVQNSTLCPNKWRDEIFLRVGCAKVVLKFLISEGVQIMGVIPNKWKEVVAKPNKRSEVLNI